VARLSRPATGALRCTTNPRLAVRPGLRHGRDRFGGAPRTAPARGAAAPPPAPDAGCARKERAGGPSSPDAAALRPGGMAAGTARLRPATSSTGAAPSSVRPTQITGPDDASHAAQPTSKSARSVRPAGRCRARWPPFQPASGWAIIGHALLPVASVVGPAAPPCKPFPPPPPRRYGARAGGASEFRTE